MTPKNKFLYRLTDRMGTIAVVPLGESNFTLDYDRQNDDKLSYQKKLSGKIMFTGEAFQRIKMMEDSVYRCDEQTLTIIKSCNGVEKIFFVGKISLNEADFNLDKCQVTLKFSEDKTDKCIDDGKATKVNLFPLVWERRTVKTASFAGVIEYKDCTHNSSEYTSSDYWCGAGTAEQGNWTVIYWYNHSPDGDHFFLKNKWAREVIEIDCSETADPSWVLIEDNCGTTGKKKFARKITTFGCESINEPPDDFGAYSNTYNCKILGYEGGTTVIDNGLHFTDAMKELLKVSCPNLTLKSDFFQINPDNPSAVNYVTGLTSKVNNILIFQKSDVKRPNSTSNATKLEISLETMLEVLKIMFNVKWRIEGNVFRLEHVSYYSKTIGFDVTSNALRKYFIGKRVYTYESQQIPQKETWKFKEQSGADWSVEITYSGCVTNTKKNEVNNIIDEAMTDITFAMQNPESDSKYVEDTGFVLISSRKIGNDFYINAENLGNGERLNNVFSWRALVRDYHYYERPMKVGKVNGVTTNFITTIPTKKGEQFAIPYNFCDATFNPDNFVKTLLGNGIVSSAKHRFKDYFLELELLYESNQDLVPNAPPTLSGGGTFSTYKETSKTIDVVASDTDGTVTALQAVNPPYNGTLNFISTSQFIYTPNAGFVGTDYFSIRALDNLSEFSNTEIFIMQVKPPNQPPVANPETYTVYIGQTFFQGTSILANDSDDNGFSLVTTNTVTAQGVAISISPSGFFNYVPPANFEGLDTFEYTIQDEAGLQSSATVTLNVINKNKPVAVEDNYQTLMNYTFVADGTLGREKLTANDYTPNGEEYVYTTTAESKQTSQGGSVIIYNDGGFFYVPPTETFVGEDSFEYTVHNPNGSRVGIAKIQVLPMIYVKMTVSDQKTEGHPSYPIWAKTQDYTLSFFSNPAGTIPFNVTGLKFKVMINENSYGHHGNNSFNTNKKWMTGILSGTSVKILDDFKYFFRQLDENFDEQENNNLTVSPFTYTVI